MNRCLLNSAISLCFLFAATASVLGSDMVSLSVSEVVAVALENNPVIREANANINVAESAVKSIRAGMLPEADFSYGYTSFMETPIMKIGGDETQVSHQRIYNWDITVIQPLFTGFALTSKLDVAKLDVTARELEKEQVILDLARNVKSACYNLMFSRRLLFVSEDEVAALIAHRRNAGFFYNQGLIRKNDLLQAQVALANSEQQLEKIRADVRKAEMLLNRLMNRSLVLAIHISDGGAGLKPDTVVTYDMAALGAEALGARPLMRLLDNGLEQLGITVKLAKSAWYPTVALVGQYEQIGDNPLATDNDYSNDYNASITAQFQWKFRMGGKTRAEVAGARQKIRALEAGIERHRNKICEEVQGAVLDCQVASGNIETAEKALSQAKENWRITDLQYQQQTALASDVLDARAFLSQTDANYYRAVYGYRDAVAGLERAIGGKTITAEGG